MSKSLKSKEKQYQNDYNDWDDNSEYLYRSKEEKLRNKRKERRIEHALKTKNLDELLEVEDDWDYN